MLSGFFYFQRPTPVLPRHKQDELGRSVFFGKDETQDFRVQSLRQGGQQVGSSVSSSHSKKQAAVFQQGIGGTEKFAEGLRRTEERTAAQVGRRHTPVAFHSPRRVGYHCIEHGRAGKVFPGGQSFAHAEQIVTSVHVSAERREGFSQPQRNGVPRGGFCKHSLALQPNAFPALLLQQDSQRDYAAARAKFRQHCLFRQRLLRRETRQQKRVRTEAETPFRLFQPCRERLARRTDVC